MRARRACPCRQGTDPPVRGGGKGAAMRKNARNGGEPIVDCCPCARQARGCERKPREKCYDAKPPSANLICGKVFGVSERCDAGEARLQFLLRDGDDPVIQQVDICLEQRPRGRAVGEVGGEEVRSQRGAWAAGRGARCFSAGREGP